MKQHSSGIIICLAITLLTYFNGVFTDTIEVCPGEIMKIQCLDDQVIVPTSALFGRMESTRCIEVEEFIGCQNDVLFLVDQWCSNRRECEIFIPNNDLKMANQACLRYLQMYIHVDYSCLQVYTPKSCRPEARKLVATEGFISSRVTDDTGCGSAQYPWIISAMSGQTIDISIIDLGSEEMNNKNSTLPIYGYVTDGATRTAIRGNTERERHLLKSKTSQLSIEIMEQSVPELPGFILHYKKSGCPDLTPPAHAWYKRDGDQAVIGCEWSQKTWHLSCDGQSWSGVVGNCSEPITQGPSETQKEIRAPSALWLVCVVSISVVVMVVALVTGVVSIKKYRIKQDIQKAMPMQRLPGQGHYDLDPNIEMASMLYLPYKACQQEQTLSTDPHRPTSYLVPQEQALNELTPIRIWQRPLPDLPDKPLATGETCVTGVNKPGRTPGDGDESVTDWNRRENHTLISSQSALRTTDIQADRKYSSLTPEIS